MELLKEEMWMVGEVSPLEMTGRVVEVRGLSVRVADFPVPVGAGVKVKVSGGKEVDGEVVGFDREYAIVMSLGSMEGIRSGDAVVSGQHARMVQVGEGLLGRVLDGMGRPKDKKGVLRNTVLRSLQPAPVEPLERPVIGDALATGVRAIDGLLPVGRGQRLGLFAGPGLGKSTLLATMARHTSADVSVIALVGERGREVRDFIENHLGEEGLKRSVVVCATGDEPALLRIRAAMTACAVAEYFRDTGRDVLLIMDSVTRFCQAQRQVGLSVGEPPATKGYPPSVFSMLPVLLERSGRTERGSITGFYAVLVEGDDMTEPVADAARGILDGHVVLGRRLANRGHWPAIEVLESISRCADDVIDKEHQGARREVLRLVGAYREVEDLLNIGAYAAGSNADFDLAIACKGAIDQLVQQGRHEVVGKADFGLTRRMVVALAGQIQSAKKQLGKMQARPGVVVPPRR